MYHISVVNLGPETVLSPRVPEDRLDSEGEQPRVCFAPTRQGAFLALPIKKIRTASALYIYRVGGEEISKLSPVNSSEVPDAPLTNEYVSFEETRVELDSTYEFDSAFHAVPKEQQWVQIIELEKEELFGRAVQRDDVVGYIQQAPGSICDYIGFKEKVVDFAGIVDPSDGREVGVFSKVWGIAANMEMGKIYFLVRPSPTSMENEVVGP